MNGQELETELLDTLAKSELKEIGKILAELGLDVKNELPIPGIGIPEKMVNASNKIQGHLFVRKLAKYLSSVDEVTSPEERAEFSARLDQDKNFKISVGENLLLLLQKLDDMRKPELIGKLFGSLMKGEIDRNDFERLAAAVDRAYFSDLVELGQDKWTDGSVQPRLASCGLRQMSEGGIYAGVLSYSGTRLGQLLVKICFGKDAVQK